MRSFFIIISILYVNVVAHGQEQIYYCLTDGELIRQHWRTADGVTIESQYRDSVCSIKVFTSEDKKLRRILRHKALYVTYKDTLYINCSRAVKDEVKIYATATKLADDKMFFVIPSDQYTNSSFVPITAGVLGGFIGGVIAGAITGVNNGKINGIPCLWNIATESVTILSPKNMKSLLRVDKELFQQYKEENRDRQTSPSVVLEYLRLLI